MPAGFTAYIDGTTYDAINSMSFNFVVDILTVSGAGSKTYSLPGFSLTAAILGGRTTYGSSQITFGTSVSGQVVSWSGVDTVSKVVVVATATTTGNYAGFVLNDYSVNPPVFKIAPPFTPFSLAQVIDLTPTGGQILQTNVPASMPFIAFHRSTLASGFNNVWWTEITQNGYWALQFRGNFGSAMSATRIYVFSKMMVNTPAAGFFMYDNGQIVWHQNCLPLKLTVGSTTTSDVPVAITSGVSVVVAIPVTGNSGYVRYNCYSAGFNISGTSKYEAQGGNTYNQVSYDNQQAPYQYSCSPPAYIETNIYDTYYHQALGV
ncbi:hypothetical protein [Pantoea sp. At-9b]|uniref:hypothetical protein n=1 Tax=Pantoea sp. (strain At-9b) TaxID=592316 RepID=UPI0001B3E52C|nr:hypothetical protein [Pantoea sp. At-9b]ADU71565.1 hypothetical protein Pat9b_5408 [Pantoea sp. At-9b]